MTVIDMKTKLAESGLTDRDRKQLKIRPLGAETIRKLGFEKRQGIKIPYTDPNGKDNGFYRIRYLEPPKGFKANSKKVPKYVQPKNTLPGVYLPQINGISWPELIVDATLPIYITEGELKAACATKHGFATIGLGGVYAWRAAKKGINLLPELQQFEWKERTVYIAFDSDFSTNSNVQKAMYHLCHELTLYGAQPMILKLPDLNNDGKTGLDDYLVAKGPEALLKITSQAEEFDEARDLWEFNGEVVLIEDPTMIVRLRDGMRMNMTNFRDVIYTNRKTIVKSVNANGDPVTKKKSLPVEWLDWPHRLTVKEQTYKPGEERFVDGSYNLWDGWACEPKRGNVKPWKELLDYLFKSNTEDHKWFEQWCAFQFQHPGIKMNSAVVMWGVQQGTGKSFVGYSLGTIMGKNFIEIKHANLVGDYNGWANSRQLVMGDEITSSNKRGDSDMLKSLITQQEVTINIKYVPEYTIPDCINYYFTSNHPDAFFLENYDRRFFIHEVIGEPLPYSFYKMYDRWLKKEHGSEALFYHLLNVDLTGFDPSAPAPVTESKKAMSSIAKSDIGLWVQELREDPNNVLQVDGKQIKADLWESKQLLRLYDPDNSTKVTSNGMAREIRRAGFRPLGKNGITNRMKGSNLRLYALRNIERWERGSIQARVEHWEQFFGGKTKKY